MAQPKIPPLSVRCKAPLRAQIDAAALAQGIKVNALVVRWIEDGLARDAAPEPKPEPKAVLAHAEAKAAHLAKPKRRHPRWSLAIQVGPNHPPPGSLLKGAGKAQPPKR